MQTMKWEQLVSVIYPRIWINFVHNYVVYEMGTVVYFIYPRVWINFVHNYVDYEMGTIGIFHLFNVFE
jgi:hypothetical protein